MAQKRYKCSIMFSNITILVIIFAATEHNSPASFIYLHHGRGTATCVKYLYVYILVAAKCYSNVM